MAIMADGRAIIAWHHSQGKRCVGIDISDPFWLTFTGERTSLRVCIRQNVAFLTPIEYQDWARQQEEGAR